jgi:hypothetical protein
MRNQLSKEYVKEKCCCLRELLIKVITLTINAQNNSGLISLHYCKTNNLVKFFMFHRYDCSIETTIFSPAYAQIFNEYSMGIRYLNQLRYVYGNDWSFIVNNIYTYLL